MASQRTLLWSLRVVWIVLLGAVGPVLLGAGERRSHPVDLVIEVGCWALWAATLLALLVPSTVSLTVARTIVPAMVPAVAVAALADRGAGSATRELLALAAAAVATALAFAPPVGQLFAQASAYGDETRRLLRAPGLLLLGPIPLAWALTVVTPVAGALLLAARQWVVGAVVLAAGVGLAWVLGRRLHRLSRRWVVFVPAGVVLHDQLAMADVVLFRRATIASLGPAPAETTATDCTGGATGLALELRLTEPAPLLLAGDLAHRSGQPVVSSAVLFTPTRPGVVLDEAARRGLRIG